MTPLSYWSKHAGIDWTLAAIPVGAYALARSAGLDPIVVLDGPGRSDLYSSLVQAAGSLLAFAVVPAAIILALTPGPRVKAILSGHSEDLRRATIHTAVAGIMLLISSIAAQGVDTDTNNTPIRYLVAWTGVATALGAFRLIDQFSILLRNVGQDQATEAAPRAPRIPRPSRAAGIKTRPLDSPPAETVRRRPVR